MRGGRSKGQAVDHYPLRGSKHGRTCFPLYLWQSPEFCGDAGCLCYTLFMWHCNSRRFLTYRWELCSGWCSTPRLAFPLASFGLLHLSYGWLCLQAQWSMNCHPFLWGITGDSSNKNSAILENLGLLFFVSPVFCKSCCEFFSFPSFQRC